MCLTCSDILDRLCCIKLCFVELRIRIHGGIVKNNTHKKKTVTAIHLIHTWKIGLIAVIFRFPSALPTTKSGDPGGHLSQDLLYHQVEGFLHPLITAPQTRFILSLKTCSSFYVPPSSIWWPEMAPGVIHLLIFPFEWDKLTLYWTSFSRGSGCSASATPIKPDSQEQRREGGCWWQERGAEGGGGGGGSFAPGCRAVFFFLRWSLTNPFPPNAKNKKTKQKSALAWCVKLWAIHFLSYNDMHECAMGTFQGGQKTSCGCVPS